MDGSFKKILCIAFGGKTGFAIRNENGIVHSGTAIFPKTTTAGRPTGYPKFNRWLQETHNTVGGFNRLATTSITCSSRTKYLSEARPVDLTVWLDKVDLQCTRLRKSGLEEFIGVGDLSSTMFEAVLMMGHTPCDKYEAYAMAILEYEASRFGMR